MMFVLLLMLTLFLADAWWWYYADRTARRARLHPGWRVFIGVSMGVASLSILLLFVAGAIRMQEMIMPEWAVVGTFIWHLLVLPAVTIPSLVLWLGEQGSKLLKRRSGPAPTPGEPTPDEPTPDEPTPDEPTPAQMTRRAFIGYAVATVPPAVTIGMGVNAHVHRDDIRVRNIDLAIRQLPPALDGMTIAHVSDTHVFSFMSDRKYRDTISITNELDADLVLHTGDLINHQLKDLPDGIQMLRQMRGRHGVFACIGNHDQIEHDGVPFERETLRADLDMLFDASRVIVINGHPVELMAPRWYGGKQSVIDWSVNELAKRRRSDAFGIMLAHHPHCFDPAADAGIPLMLGGHSHGGQIGLSDQLSFGPLMYRYWSGAYQKNDSHAVISNGVGNWFPLRVNVPCEIIKLTLRHA